MDGNLLGGEQHKQTKHWTGRLENEVDDVGLCLGFLAGDESAERGRRTEREGKGKKEREREREKEKERKSADV